MLSGKDVRSISRGDAQPFIDAHYLHSWPAVVISIFGLFIDGHLSGICVFSLPPRETLRRYCVESALELARLYLIDEAPKNSETWFISRAVKAVQREWPHVELVISYADPSAGHTGLIYRAGSWIFDGKTDAQRKHPRFDLRDTSTGILYHRASQVPANARCERIPRNPKLRFIRWLDGFHERRRKLRI